jgi:hypothetical protein
LDIALGLAILLKNWRKPMHKIVLATALLLSAFATSGCVPLVIGAGGAIAADTIAEDNGSDLF